MRPHWLIVFAILAAFLPSPARAEEGDDVDAIVRHGLELRRARKDAEALDEFRRAYALRPAPRALAQIGLAEQALGRWIDAEADLAGALAVALDPWIARNRALLEGDLARIRDHLGWLDVTTNVPQAELWLNGARVGNAPTPAPIRIEAGSAVIELRAAGHRWARRITLIEPRERSRETITLVPISPEVDDARPPVVTPAPASPGPASRAVAPPIAPPIVPVDRPLRNVGIVVSASGIVALGAGAYFGARTLETKVERDRNCRNDACNPRGYWLDAQAHAMASRSTVWIATGLLAAGAGAFLFWESRSRTIHPTSIALRVAPSLGADRAGVVLGGSW